MVDYLPTAIDVPIRKAISRRELNRLAGQENGESVQAGVNSRVAVHPHQLLAEDDLQLWV
jgi:hypothetical protein